MVSASLSVSRAASALSTEEDHAPCPHLWVSAQCPATTTQPTWAQQWTYKTRSLLTCTQTCLWWGMAGPGGKGMERHLGFRAAMMGPLLSRPWHLFLLASPGRLNFIPLCLLLTSLQRLSLFSVIIWLALYWLRRVWLCFEKRSLIVRRREVDNALFAAVLGVNSLNTNFED